MSSSTMSKRLCTALPRPARALSLYSLQQHIDAGPPPPQPYARPAARHPPTPTNTSPQNASQPQTSQPLAPAPPLQIALSPPGPSRAPQTAASQPHLFSPPSAFPYLAPTLKPRRTPFRLQAGAYGIPKRRTPAPVPAPVLDTDLNLAVQVGEDAYFMRADAMGVADGVGGWARRTTTSAPASSALFARSLMHFCADNASRSDPVAVLQQAYERCIEAFRRAGVRGGSATALVAVLRGAELRIAHLGDCAVCVVRDGGIVYRSEEMQHAFNYPLQLGPSSPTLPAHARAISLPVRQNDIVILASDGMTDNLWDEDVLDEVAKFSTARCEWLPSLLSQALCSRAAAVARGGAEGPFARRAKEEGVKFVGGKCDDISVLVAVISPQGDSVS